MLPMVHTCLSKRIDVVIQGVYKLLSSGDSPLQPPEWLREKWVKCLYCTTPVRPVPACHLQGERVALGRLAHQSLFFTLLELPEILLNQESGIELPNGHFIICKGVFKKKKN